MRRLGIAIVLVLSIGFATWALWPAAAPAPDWSADYDTTVHAPETIPPGTVIEHTAPAGWSHLVDKSLPRVRPADRGKVSDLTARWVSWMFTAFLADVRIDEGDRLQRYRLKRVALGLGTKVKGRDTILTPESADGLGVHLDFIERSILSRGYEIQRLAVVVFHGPTMALVDTPVWFRCGDKNKLVRFRYALLVDAQSGRLDVLVWGLDLDRGGCFTKCPNACLLRPNLVAEADLIPDLNEFNTLGFPSDSAFAVDSLPPARQTIVLPPELRPLTDDTRFTPEEAHDLEAKLRQLLSDRADRN